MDGTETGPRVTPNASNFQDKTIINRIMLRFRPIAPKPVSGDSTSDQLHSGNDKSAVCRKRVKRKYVRVSKNNNPKNFFGETARSHVDETKNDVVTLQLLPERSDLEEGKEDSRRTWFDLNRTVTITRDDDYMNDEEFRFIDNNNVSDDFDLTALGLRDRTAVMSWVMVESVTDNCMGEGMGCTDVERVNNLERDTCPGFISDGYDKVVWVNKAYLEMITGCTNRELTVTLVINERLQSYKSPSFTGRVNLQYDTWQDEKRSRRKDLTVPFDLWRMDFGGFAWRLDVNVALCLGL